MDTRRNLACLNATLDGYLQCPDTHDSIQTEGEELALLNTRSYEAEDIKKRCIDHLQRDHDQMSESQRDAQSKLQRLIARHSNPDMRSWLSKKTMTKYMKLFAQLFFFKHMIPYISISMGGYVPDHDNDSEPYGLTAYDEKKDAPHVKIWLSKCLFLSGKENQVQRRTEILHTLLHEMTHAIFMIYCCNGSECWTDENLRDTMGLTGHGPSWAAVFLALKEKLLQIPGLEFLSTEGKMGLGLLQAIKHEMIATDEEGLDPHPYLVTLEVEEEEEMVDLEEPV